MSLNVPSILKYLSDNERESCHDYIKLEEMDSLPRAKKRRLDHLSWEEKLQRKKLKNRVAAQTSRDRKKAKMEQMESAVQELFLKNKSLLEECKELKNLNKRLTEENTRLKDKIDTLCTGCHQNPFVECEVQQGSAESIVPLPKGLNTHSAVALKTQTFTALWKIVLACLLYQTSSVNLTGMWTSTRWNSLHKVSCKISPQTWRLLLKRQITKSNSPEAMVGPTSENVESGGLGDCIKVEKKELEQEISPYLLLHHDYSVKQEPPDEQTTTTKKQNVSKRSHRKRKLQNTKLNTKFKLIMPKIEDAGSNLETVYVNTLNVSNDGSDDIVYGTLDESTNCITIIVNDDNLNLSETVTEVVTSDEEQKPDVTQRLEVPCNRSDEDGLSPPYSMSSDNGYESCVDDSGIDMWDKSVSELFPMLL